MKNPINSQNHFNTFSIKESPNIPNYTSKLDLNKYNSSIIQPQMHLSNQNVNNMSMALSNYSNISKFKNRKNHEKENRIMTLELVK